MQLVLNIKEKKGQVKTELIVKDQEKATKYEKMIANFYYNLIRTQIEGNNQKQEETKAEEV